MIYFYHHEISPNLDMLESEILSSYSEISDVYNYLRWDESDKQLKVILNRELNSEEKQGLDSIVEGI